MKLLHTISETREEIQRARRNGASIGLVPTMGALHEGHMALVGRARTECDFVIVSIFVNPTQFGPTEDFAKYPRTLGDDARCCERAGVDVVFAPSAEEMYPEGYDTWIDVGGITEVLEGESRPGHYRGVATVCAKLFNTTGPSYAYFGMKDYQQLRVIRKMVTELNMPLEIVPVETVREPDGLALSSRNRYLSTDERRAAVVLSRALNEASAAFHAGERDADAIQECAAKIIRAEPLAQIDYVVVVDAESLRPINRIERPAVVLLAVRVGATRLIDNIVLA